MRVQLRASSASCEFSCVRVQLRASSAPCEFSCVRVKCVRVQLRASSALVMTGGAPVGGAQGGSVAVSPGTREAGGGPPRRGFRRLLGRSQKPDPSTGRTFWQPSPESSNPFSLGVPGPRIALGSGAELPGERTPWAVLEGSARHSHLTQSMAVLPHSLASAIPFPSPSFPPSPIHILPY